MSYLPILTYHRLLAQDPTQNVDPHRISVSQNQFRNHLRWLKRLGYRTLSLPDYIHTLRQGGKIPGRSFAITFDDGYEEVLTLGLPLLQEAGYTATVFAVPGQLGGANVWDNAGARLLAVEGLRILDQAGITIGAHTCQHVHLTRVSPAIAKREISESRKILEECLKKNVALFAYPYGETNDSVDQYAREAGFAAAFATDNAPRDHDANLFRLRRSVVFPRTNVWEILWKVQRWYPAYQDWKRGER
jgi:peptidoglycan/xylan/chitin deacetylase (PgdA/CDA1 family)